MNLICPNLLTCVVNSSAHRPLSAYRERDSAATIIGINPNINKDHKTITFHKFCTKTRLSLPEINIRQITSIRPMN